MAENHLRVVKEETSMKKGVLSVGISLAGRFVYTGAGSRLWFVLAGKGRGRFAFSSNVTCMVQVAPRTKISK
jgi:ethanolamine utilization protein EutA (predicted chaperonin)